MAGSHEVWLLTDAGTRLALIDQPASLDYAIALHQAAPCTLVLPSGFDRTLLARDRRIAIYRTPTSGPKVLQRVYLIRRLQEPTYTRTVTGLDANDFLDSRIVAYAAGSAQAEMTDQADDICKEVVRDNLGADAAAARQVSGLTVAGNLGAGPSVTMAFAWRLVGDILRELAEATDGAGTPVYWDVAPTSETAWQFRTWTGQPGQDHTWPSGVNPVLLSLEDGTLAEPELDQDWTDEITYVYAGGQEEKANRQIVQVEDTTRTGQSLYGRREAFADASSQGTTAGVTAAANDLLATGRPIRRFVGRIQDSPGVRYGVEWRWGDRVSALYQGQQFDALVKAVRVQVDGNGLETVEARLEVG